jgi:quercetin dioxygenase-like cupin family protein
MRSLIELPGLNVSIFASTSALTSPRVMLLMRTMGVCPIVSRMVSQILWVTRLVYPLRFSAPSAPLGYIRHHPMPRLIAQPTVIAPAGNKPKRIEEYAGRVNSGDGGISVARMISPQGWVEPGQRPEFQEVTLVLRGMLRVEHTGGVTEVRAGQAIVTEPGEWVRYSTPEDDGAEYVAVCTPAFSPETVHRDAE